MEKFKLQHEALEYVEDHEDFEDWADNDSIWVPGKMEVCPTCGGTGRMDRKDLDMSRMTDSMLEDGDMEGYEHYMKGGYDVGCDQCNGANVVFAPNWEFVPKWASDAIESWEDSRRRDEAESAAERRMGA